jgi:16S rRNA G966 N2-methylase RsmD
VTAVNALTGHERPWGVDLFGMPACDPEKSQWFTPSWLARRAAEWLSPGMRVIEPSCGSGNLLEALYRNRHQAQDLLAIDIDHRWAEYAYARFDQADNVLIGNFLTDPRTRLVCETFRPDAVFMNPPYEDNLHTQFVLRALELAPIVVGIFPVNFEFTQDRDRLLWATKGYVVRRARMPARVNFGGTGSAQSDTVVLKIKRRTAPRKARELLFVTEETWTEEAA